MCFCTLEKANVTPTVKGGELEELEPETQVLNFNSWKNTGSGDSINYFPARR